MATHFVALFTNHGDLLAEVFDSDEFEKIVDNLNEMYSEIECLKVIRVETPDPKEVITVTPAVIATVNLGE